MAIVTDLTKLNNQELAKRIYDYLIRIDSISAMISSHLNDKKRIDKDFVRAEYSGIKAVIREDAHQVSLQRNKEKLTSPVQMKFIWAVEEA